MTPDAHRPTLNLELPRWASSNLHAQRFGDREQVFIAAPAQVHDEEADPNSGGGHFRFRRISKEKRTPLYASSECWEPASFNPERTRTSNADILKQKAREPSCEGLFLPKPSLPIPLVLPLPNGSMGIALATCGTPQWPSRCCPFFHRPRRDADRMQGYPD